jgi:hypothetical protein
MDKDQSVGTPVFRGFPAGGSFTLTRLAESTAKQERPASQDSTSKYRRKQSFGASIETERLL